jgi:VanZ family protein
MRISKTNTLNQVPVINLIDKMLRVKNSRVFVPATILYAIFIFYLSVTSNIGNLKHLLGNTLGEAIVGILSAAHLSTILKFLVGSLHFVERHSLDPGHMGIYFGLGVLLYFVFLSSRNQTLEKYAATFAIIVGTSYGILNEFFQMFLPYRTATVADALSNLLGLVLAQICVIIFLLALSAVQNKTTEEAAD